MRDISEEEMDAVLRANAHKIISIRTLVDHPNIPATDKRMPGYAGPIIDGEAYIGGVTFSVVFEVGEFEVFNETVY